MQYTTLSQLQHMIQLKIAQHFNAPIWISCEISELKVNSSGHCYLELVEKGESSAAAKAQARGVIWRSAYGQISTRFKQLTTMELQRGVLILAQVVVNYHELYGLSLQILDIDPTYTIGEAELRRRMAIEKLQKDGNWDVNRSRPLPTVVQRIAVVASSKSAGFEDFMREIERSNYHFEITLFDAVMQGGSAENSIIEALIAIANRRGEFDVVAVLRGGGSSNDLECFNSYRLALHFARFPLPVISGIGHERDVSVVDMVAHVMVKTPTALANWLDERMLMLDAQLQSKALELHNLTIDRVKRAEMMLSNYTREMTTRCEELLYNKKSRLTDLEEQIPTAAYNTLSLRSRELEQLSKIVDGYSPRRIMEIGFSIARSADTKRVLRSVEGVNIDDIVTIGVADGELETKIVSITKQA